MGNKEEEPRTKLQYEDLFDGKIENNRIGTLEKFFKCVSTSRTPQEGGGLLPSPLAVLAWEGGRVVATLTTHTTPLQANNINYCITRN